ncbi:MAG: nuclease-related domain-containing protein [Candidatus Lokiarchaeia archaeon]
MKNEEERLIRELEAKKLELQESLIKEKEELMSKSLGSKGKKRLKKIDKTLEKKLDKPFKKDVKQIKKTEKEHVLREKNLEKTVEKSVKHLHKAHDVIEKDKQFFVGAIGETAAIKELKKLPETYYIINEARLSFSRSIRWKKYHEYVKSCKIDHVVIGPTGIFLIETKNWSHQSLLTARFTPHKQIDRAGYIFFIHMMDRFKRKLPVYQIVATYKELPQIRYRYVDQLTIKELVNFILGKKRSLDDFEIQIIVKWLQSSPFIRNSGFKLFKWF